MTKFVVMIFIDKILVILLILHIIRGNVMVVEAGRRITVSHLTFEIVEVIPYETPSGGRHFLVAYRIHDHGYTSPVAHFWISEAEASTEKLKDKLAEIAHYYKELKSRGIQL